ncbi:MAG TPA: hypothetical protein VGU66_11115 [Candidatus Elarobacter sp.]|nr:hypothetical protein [Candidatus Elarobacter sp.]
MRARVAGIIAAVLATLAFAAPAQAASGKIFSFTTSNSGNITFTVPGLSNVALPGSQSYAYALSIRTSPLQGTVTITAPLINGTAGNKIPQSAFQAQCTATSDPGGIFTSSGLVRLSASAVTCGTVAANSNNSINFDVTLYLDCTPDASSFTADTYTNALMSITANAP